MIPPSDTPTQVLIRDDHQCVISGHKGKTHPSPLADDSEARANLKAAHIIRRAIAVFDDDELQSKNVSATDFHFSPLPSRLVVESICCGNTRYHDQLYLANCN